MDTYAATLLRHIDNFEKMDKDLVNMYEKLEQRMDTLYYCKKELSAILFHHLWPDLKPGSCFTAINEYNDLMYCKVDTIDTVFEALRICVLGTCKRIGHTQFIPCSDLVKLELTSISEEQYNTAVKEILCKSSAE